MKARLLHLFILIFSFLISLQAQKKEFVSLQEALVSSRSLSGPKIPSNINWINDGASFSYTKNSNGNQEIWTRDPASGQETRVFTTSGLTFPDGERFRYSSFSWTRDFSYLLFQTRVEPVYRYSGNADYFVYSLAEGNMKPLVEHAFTAEISPDGKKLGYGRDGEIYTFDFASSTHKQLTFDAMENVYNGRFGWAYEEEFGLVQAWDWSPDSRYIAYWQSDEREVPLYQLTDFQGKHPEYKSIPYPKVGDPCTKIKIGVLDTETAAQRWLDLDLNGGYVPRIYWTSRPDVLAVIEMNREQNQLKLWFFNVKTGDKKLVMEEKSATWIDVYDFFSGKLHFFFFPEETEEFFWISERDGFAHIYRYNYEGKLLNQVTSGNWEVTSIEAIDVAKKTLYYTSREVSPLEVNLFSVRFDGTKKQRLTTAEGNHEVNVSTCGQYYFDSYSTCSTPPSAELKTAKGKVLDDFGGNIQVEKYLTKHVYAPCELFSFTTSDGQKLDGYLIKPIDFDSTRSYPLVLDIYGGPGSQSVYNSFENNGWHQWLAQKGYVVASVNNRGNGGYGSAFEKIVYGHLGKWETWDFAETALYLSEKSWIDRDRMAIRGHSYGGFTSAFSLLTHPEVFLVGIVTAPVTDHRLYDCIFTERYMGLLENNEEGYEETAATNYAANLKGHMLLVHSLMDDNVHPQNTFQLLRALLDNGKDVDLKIYPPGDHGVAYDFTTYMLLMQSYTDYLDRYLMDVDQGQD
ncbi:MAG: DPP IV N-terminal domain-containing protein [Bacteroidota bacterium]